MLVIMNVEQRINIRFCVKISKGAIEILAILKSLLSNQKYKEQMQLWIEAECVQMTAEGVNMNGENSCKFWQWIWE